MLMDGRDYDYIATSIGMSKGSLRQMISRDSDLKDARLFNKSIGDSSPFWDKCPRCSMSFEVKRSKMFCSDKCQRNYSRQKSIDDFKSKKMYYLYYIPEEHYIGVSNDPKRRMQNHGAKGKITDNWEVFFESSNPRLVAYYEALFHLIGYNGSNYDNMLKSREKK